MQYFNDLKVRRLVVHEVHRRSESGPLDPDMGTSLVDFNPEAHDFFCSRVCHALGSSNRCVEMTLLNSGEGSTFAVAQSLLGVDDAAFVPLSQAAALKLAHAQSSIAFPGGLLMVFEGTTSYPSKRYIGFLKAEPQSGFRKNLQKGVSILEFIKNLFLTPDAKVYKIGIFVEDNPNNSTENGGNGFKFFLFDANIANKETQKAATYFYENFLGLTYLSSNARQTRNFISATYDFIAKGSFTEEEKMDLKTAVNAYMRLEQSQIASAQEFGERYLKDAETIDSFLSVMEKNRVPIQPFTKDLSESSSLLKRRKVRFGGDIQLVVPAEKFKEKIKIETLPQDDGSVWSRVTIRDKLIGE